MLPATCYITVDIDIVTSNGITCSRKFVQIESCITGVTALFTSANTGSTVVHLAIGTDSGPFDSLSSCTCRFTYKNLHKDAENDESGNLEELPECVFLPENSASFFLVIAHDYTESLSLKVMQFI